MYKNLLYTQLTVITYWLRFDVHQTSCLQLVDTILSIYHAVKSWRVARLVHNVGQAEKLKKKTKNKSRSIITLVQSHDCEGSPGVEEVLVLRWEGFVEKVGFWAWYWKSEGAMDDDSADDDRDERTREWGGESRHDWRGWQKESTSLFQRRGDAYLNGRSVIFNDEMVGGEIGWQPMRSGYCEGVEQRSDC